MRVNAFRITVNLRIVSMLHHFIAAAVLCQENLRIISLRRERSRRNGKACSHIHSCPAPSTDRVATRRSYRLTGFAVCPAALGTLEARFHRIDLFGLVPRPFAGPFLAMRRQESRQGKEDCKPSVHEFHLFANQAVAVARLLCSPA